MYKINLLHRLPETEQIDVKYFFDDHKIKNKFFENNDLFLSLKDTKEESLKAAMENENLICVRNFIKKPNYTIPPFFTSIEKKYKLQEYIKENFLKGSLLNVAKPKQMMISFMFDLCKSNHIQYENYKNEIIDFCIDKDVTKAFLKDNFKTIIKSLENGLKSNEIIDLFDKIEKELELENLEKIENEKIRVKKELIDTKEFVKSKLINIIEHEMNSFFKFFKLKTNKNEFKNYLQNHIKNKLSNKQELDIFCKKINDTLLTLNDDVKEYKKEEFFLESFDFKKINNVNIDDFFSLRYICKTQLKSYILENNYYSYSNTMSFKDDCKSFSFNFAGKPKNINKVYNFEILKDTYILEPKELDDHILKLKNEFFEYFKEKVDKDSNEILKEFKLTENLNKLLKSEVYHELLSKLEINVEKSVQVFFNYNIFEKEEFTYDEIKKETIDQVYKYTLQDFNIREYILNNILQSNLDIKSFKDLFTYARNRGRELIYFKGPTNSGKTYSAFEELKKYDSGVYLAPLRLLALEGQEEIEKRGKICSMITGEERNLKPNARFISSTIEMVDYDKKYDVAIIDEVQMLKDKDRSAAWLQAIVGVNAKKVILVGSPDIEDQINDIADYLGEKLTIQGFERKTKISFSKDLYNNHIVKTQKFPPNTAIITFSKKNIEALKLSIEKRGNKVSVIYGALPPEVRKSECERFAKGETDVVIATDAIGMGLNLPIENLFFYEHEKFNGTVMEDLEGALVKQIVGRAGRYNMFEVGNISAYNNDTFDYVKRNFEKNSHILDLEYKCNSNYALINQIQNITKEESLFKLLQIYNENVKFDFNIQNYIPEYGYEISRFLDKFKNKNVFTLHEKVKLINAPVPSDRYELYLKYFFTQVKTLYNARMNGENINTIQLGKVSSFEEEYKKLDVLSWFSFGFEEYSYIKEDLKEDKKILQIKWNKSLKKTIDFTKGKKK